MKLRKNKAFTLIELLVVVAIIGILAAVGVTTFGGFQDKAKVNSTKAIHKSVQKKIAAEVVKCTLGDSTIFSGKVTCSTTPSTLAGNINSTLGSGNKDMFSDTNPFGSGLAVKTGGSFTLGQVSLSVSSADIILKTCFKDACSSSDNQLQDTITVE